MSDESYSFTTARARLEEIVTQVRKKDTSLEKSLDLLEEGVRLANACTELIDHADWTVGGVQEPAEGGQVSGEATEGVVAGGGGLAVAVEASGAGAEGSEAAVQTAEEAAEPASEDAEFAPDDDAFGDAANEAWADGTPEYRDDEA